MKAIRLCLLLLLAALLPLRGAMAAAMLCPMAGMQNPALAAAAPAGHEHMDHALHHAAAGQQDAKDASSTGKCNMCAAFCSLTPLPSEMPRLAEPPALSAVKFPDLSTPAPSFVSDGQDRPPRPL